MQKETDNVTDDAVSNILAFSRTCSAAAGTDKSLHPRGRSLEDAERAVVLLIEELDSVLSCMTIKDIMFLAYLHGAGHPTAGALLEELKKC